MGVERKIWEPPIWWGPNDWTLDSKTLVMQERTAAGKYRLVRVPADGTGQASTLLDVPTANLASAQLSPDGHWIAFQSDESGRYEIYVSAFPKPEGKLQISLVGGRHATWRHDGKELYYLAPDGNLMAAELKEGDGALQASSPRTLFQTKALAPQDSYDAFPDGKKFLVQRLMEAETAATINLVINWPAELKK